jgi:hypothetical protein
LTTSAESVPLLSQSMKPTPPLIDSTMNFLSGDAMWDTVSPARALMSSNTGTGGVCLAFWVPLAAQHKTTSGTAIEKMWEENGFLTLWRVRKTK